MSNYVELKHDLDERLQLYPNVYHDIIPLQLLQSINSYLVRHDLPSIIRLDILSLYETIVSKLFKFDTKTKKDKPVLLKGSEKRIIIAYCIYKVCVLKNIDCGGIDKVRNNMGIAKNRMISIQQRYHLE